MKSGATVYILDVHYLIFRAYHALPAMTAPDGTPTGAVRGYLQTIVRLLRELAPDYIGGAADFSLTSFRNELYPGYKEGRTEAPADLEPQFALCEAGTRALGVPYLALRNFEADDVMATLVRRFEPECAALWLVTRDKDLAALVSERVGLMDPRGRERTGPEEVEARFGVPPALIPDYLTLVGDATDRIPGVPGIGPATARALLRHYGGLDRIPSELESFGRIGRARARRIGACLQAGRAKLELSRRLVRLRDDLPLDVTLEGLRYRGARRAELSAFLSPLGLSGLLERVPRWLD